MIYKCGDINFKYAWLDYIVQDPVHPSISAYDRITGNRTVFVFAEGDEPQFIVSAKINGAIARSMKDVMTDSQETCKECATFYSIFRVPGSSSKGRGGEVIKKIIDYCKLHGIEQFCTLSPVPFLKNNFDEQPKDKEAIKKYLETQKGPVEKFHLRNGASIDGINFKADTSDLRSEESWGIMINYRYE